MKLALRLALLVALLASPSLLAADGPEPADPLFQPEPVLLQASASCEGEAGGAEIFVSCPGQTASQCCQTTKTSHPGFVGVCQGRDELFCS